MMNSACFINNARSMPKFVVIQWPSIYRTALLTEKLTFLMPMLDLLNNKLKSYYDVYLDNNNPDNHAKISIIITQLLWKLKNIPLFEFTLDTEQEIDVPKFMVGSIDTSPNLLARDVLHHGVEYHTRLADWIYKNTNEKSISN